MQIRKKTIISYPYSNLQSLATLATFWVIYYCPKLVQKVSVYLHWYFILTNHKCLILT